MADVIRIALSNFPLTFLILGLIAAGLSLLRKPRPWSKAKVVEALFSWFLLFTVGLSYFYNFVMHVFFGEVAARYIGWQTSPFQAEVGFASLGFAVLGFLAFRGAAEMRLAAVVAPACFLWGAAAGHVHQMITAGNYAPGNAGVIFWMDIIQPLVGFALLWLQRRTAKESATAEAPRRNAISADSPQPAPRA